MRIDKFLCGMNIGSRSQVKELIKCGQVQVNGQLIRNPDYKVDENKDMVICQGKQYGYRPFVYYMMNKPAGVVTAVRDGRAPTVMDIFVKQYGLLYQKDLTGLPLRDIFPVGRLDKGHRGPAASYQ